MAWSEVYSHRLNVNHTILEEQAKRASLSEKCFKFGIMSGESVVNFIKGVVARGCSYCLPAAECGRLQKQGGFA